ncbi:MAG: IS5 family transposase, partial [Armatimonadota bacterium]|nr:IS5 family transposase [Armatimonadota bacterium]
MRGDDLRQDILFSYLSPEARVPQNHPLRPIRQLVDRILAALSPAFARLYARTGRPSVPPEQLLRALLLQVLYTIRSERLLIEQLDYNLLFRWFVGLSLDDPVWDATTFTKNRQRLLDGEIAQRFFEQVRAEAAARGLLSDEHFTVDSTLLEAWASLKSFRRRDQDRPSPPDDPGNPTVDFRGERCSNATHASTTAPEARLARRGDGREAHLAYQGHVLMENRHGLVVAACVTAATGTAEREAAVALVQPVAGR